VLFDTPSGIVGTLGSTLTGTVLGYDATLSFANGTDDLLLTIAVPEPSAAASLLGGFALLLGWQRRRPQVGRSNSARS
jgi:hypothetical protein